MSDLQVIEILVKATTISTILGMGEKVTLSDEWEERKATIEGSRYELINEYGNLVLTTDDYEGAVGTLNQMNRLFMSLCPGSQVAQYTIHDRHQWLLRAPSDD